MNSMPRITKENIFKYFSEGENDIIEFKRSIPNRFEIIERLISAFSNTKGGFVIFGYDEPKKEIVGVNEAQIQTLISMCNEQQYKKYCSVYSLLIDNKLVAVLEIKKSRADIYVNGVAYIRNGDMVFSKVGNIRSKYLKEFIEEIQYRNRNPKHVKVLDLLNDISTNPERKLSAGTRLYRCRVIPDLRKLEKKEKEQDKDKGFFGYGKDDSFVPPANVTRDLRANYRYIPYLYCANHPYTAVVEVRPRLGANVSVASIRVNEKLTLLDFTLKTIPKNMSPTKFHLFADLSMLFSKPVTSEDDILDYIPTQYIAEFAKNIGYDGIVFRSSLTPELEDQDIDEHQELDRYNIVVFNYEKCEAVGSNVVCVTRNYLEYKQIDQDSNRIDVNSIYLDMRY